MTVIALCLGLYVLDCGGPVGGLWRGLVSASSVSWKWYDANDSHTLRLCSWDHSRPILEHFVTVTFLTL